MATAWPVVLPAFTGTLGPRSVVPSLKATAPDRLPVPAPVVTVAVKETDWPNPEGLGFETRAVVVELTLSLIHI